MHICVQVHILQLHDFGLFEQLPANKHDEHDGQLKVKANKAHGIEFGAETAPSLDKNDEAV